MRPLIKSYIAIAVITVFSTLLCAAQSSITSAPPRPSPTPAPTPEKAKTQPTPDPKAKLTTADQVAETAILIYGLGGGRVRLDQIRKTSIEKGKLTVTQADGKIVEAGFERYTLRGGTLDKERIRIDQNFPDARYALIWADAKTVGLYNTTVFPPRDDVVRSFENTIFRGVDGLLRYKENDSTIELAGREKEMGVEYYLVDVTDKAERKTRYYVSVKTFRVMMVTYEEAGVKYRRKFYDQNYTQGTLVASRSVLTADGKVVEETQINSVIFGQKIDEEMFKVS